MDPFMQTVSQPHSSSAPSNGPVSGRPPRDLWRDALLSEVAGYEKKAGNIVSSLNKDSVAGLEKWAQARIADPTESGITTVVRRHLEQVLTPLGDVRFPVRVDVHPVGPTIGTQWPNAAGQARIIIGKTPLILPFRIHAGEWEGFDHIQLGNEKAVYTPQNLQRVISGVHARVSRAARSPHGMEDANRSPFLGLADRLDSLTDPGFLGNILRIQEMAGNFGYVLTKNDQRLADARAYAALEKIAIVHPAPLDRLAAAGTQATRRALALAKTAASSTDENLRAGRLEDWSTLVQNALTGMAHVQWRALKDLTNAHAIRFLEKDNRSVALTQGMVYHQLWRWGPPQRPRVPVSETSLVFSGGSVPRYRVWTRGQQFWAVESAPDAPDIAHTAVPAGALRPGYVYTLVEGPQALLPFAVRGTRLGSDFGVPARFVHLCHYVSDAGPETALGAPTFEFLLVDAGEQPDAAGTGDLAAPRSVNPAAWVASWQERTSLLDPGQFWALLGHPAPNVPVVAVRPRTAFWRFQAPLNDVLTVPSTFFFQHNDDVLKTAAVQDNEVRMTMLNSDVEDPLVRLELRWVTPDGHPRQEAWDRLPLTRANAVLRSAGFPAEDRGTWLHRVTTEKHVRAAFATGEANPERAVELYGQPSWSKDIKGWGKKLFGPDAARKFLTTVAGQQLAGVIDPSSSTGQAVSAVAKLAGVMPDVSEHVARWWENATIGVEHPAIQSTVELLAAKAHWDQKLAAALDAPQSGMEDAMTALAASRPVLEHCASELVAYARDAGLSETPPIEIPAVHAALEQLAGLVRYASVAAVWEPV